MHDKRVTDLIKKYLKSGVMENGVHCKTEEGSPQGGSLSLLLANIYLNEFDQEMEKVKVYDRVWIGYFYVADIKRILQSWNGWLRRRLRMYIWKGWKKSRT
ncbi:group II intron maturase-specific domain-containing protein [Paenibacillus aquistagni]|uniref:group II intron maturase-specific domain-containing protein n=1 Tax=Paenibacillus aquistagni TaxID=1852522 RepID=UPI000A1CCF51